MKLLRPISLLAALVMATAGAAAQTSPPPGAPSPASPSCGKKGGAQAEGADGREKACTCRSAQGHGDPARAAALLFHD